MPDLLAVEALTAGYGEAVVIEDVSFTLAEGESVALLGRNGAGKSTLVATLMGLTRLQRGSIRLRGREIGALPPFDRVAAGLGWVPQERRVFASLTVEEHLEVVARPGAWTAARVCKLFPALAARRALLGSQLSGGEQQMLAIGRALTVNPAVLLLDEPMEGLAPLAVQALADAIRELGREGRMSILLVEQHARLALSLAASAVILERGRIVHRGPSRHLVEEPSTLAGWLSVAG